jgi:hypothetical protein
VFLYFCPRCGEELHLRQAVTLRRRICPRCGELIRKKEILLQEEKQRQEHKRAWAEYQSRKRLKSLAKLTLFVALVFLLDSVLSSWIRAFIAAVVLILVWKITIGLVRGLVFLIRVFFCP